jgi:hypothetical protein
MGLATVRWAGVQPIRQSRGPSSVWARTWLGALRSGRVVLSRPSQLPMAPADFRSALHRFAGSLLIGFAATGHRGMAARGHNTPVPRRISPVPWPAVQPFRSPYPGGSIGAALPSSSRRRSPSPIFAGLGSRTCPATQASLTRRQDSSSYGPVGCSPPKGTLSWRFDGRVSPSAGHQLRGCLAITPTGLSPASRPQLLQDTPKIGSNTAFAAAITTRSATVGIPSGRDWPGRPGFGMWTRGSGRGR